MNIEWLKNVYPRFIREEIDYLAYLENPIYDKNQVVLSLVSANIHLAICNITINKDYLTARNNFYKAALAEAYLDKYYDDGTYTSYNIFATHYSFCYAIICDDKNVLNHYLKYSDNFLNTFGSSFAKAIQSSVENDDVELEVQIKNLERHTNGKSIAKNYTGVALAFKGMLQNDKIIIKQGINEILSKHSMQDQPAVVKDYLNIEALTIAKLAYRKGITIEIDSQILPKEMIPLQELEKYENYSFLDNILL
jgi:hypothetical protein